MLTGARRLSQSIPEFEAGFVATPGGGDSGKNILDQVRENETS
jgi:hypothetical protein